MMTKLLAGKLSTFIAAVTTSLILSGCETTDGKPEMCKAGSNCAAKAKVVKKAPATRSSRSDSSRGGGSGNY